MNRASLVALVLCCASCSTNPAGAARSVLRGQGFREEVRGWMELAVVPRPVDLMALTDGLSTILARQPMGPATSTELCLGVGAAHLIRDGAEVPLDVPSGASSGSKLKGNLIVVPDPLVELSLDFEPGQSIHVSSQTV